MNTSVYKSLATKLITIITCIIILAACASQTPTPANTGPDPLDVAIRDTSDYLNGRLTQGIKLVFLNFQSEYPALSEYVIDGLIENTVNDDLFTVVDRQNLAVIQQEMNFQLSGEVSDESAQAIGKQLGAQVIVSGAISPLGNSYRLRVRAISVETAEIEGQINQDIDSSPRLAALIANGGAALSQTTYPTGDAAVSGQAGSSTRMSSAPSTTPSPANMEALPYEKFVIKRKLDIVNTGAFTLSPDGKYVIVESNTGQKLCDIETGKVIKNLNIPRFTVATFSPDGRRVITGSGYRIHITDIETGAYRECIGHIHPATLHSLSYSPDGKYFISAASPILSGGKNPDNTVRVWNAETGQELLTISGHDGNVGYAVFSPDGQIVVSRDARTIYFWNAADGQLLRTISNPLNKDSRYNFRGPLAISPNGTKVAAIVSNRIIVFDAQNGRELFNFTGHQSNIIDMVFNPEGNRLLSVSQGDTNNLYAWNMASGWGTPNNGLKTGGGYSSLAISSDGSILVINTVGRNTYVLGME